MCLQRDLQRATEEAREGLADAYRELAATLDQMFLHERTPIREQLLKQLVETTPAERFFSLIFMCHQPWFPVDGERFKDVPQWLGGELENARQALAGER